LGSNPVSTEEKSLDVLYLNVRFPPFPVIPVCAGMLNTKNAKLAIY
jgi:hypothetical protein